MSKTDPTLAQEAKARPDDTFRVIVRVHGDLDARQGQLEELSFTITRRLRLIHGFAGTATGATVQRVLDEEWIISVEPDSEVHTMHGDS